VLQAIMNSRITAEVVTLTVVAKRVPTRWFSCSRSGNRLRDRGRNALIPGMGRDLEVVRRALDSAGFFTFDQLHRVYLMRPSARTVPLAEQLSAAQLLHLGTTALPSASLFKKKKTTISSTSV